MIDEQPLIFRFDAWIVPEEDFDLTCDQDASLQDDPAFIDLA